jgi:hypothetical protein
MDLDVPPPPATLDLHFNVAANEYTLNYYGNGITPIKLDPATIHLDKVNVKDILWEFNPTIELVIDRSAKSTASLISKRNIQKSKYDLLLTHLRAGTFPRHINCKIITHVKQNTDEIQKLVNTKMLTEEIISTAAKHNQINDTLKNMTSVLLQDLHYVCQLDILRKDTKIPFTDCKDNLFLAAWLGKISDHQLIFAHNIKMQEDIKNQRKEKKETAAARKAIEKTTRTNAAIAAGVSSGNIQTIDQTAELQQQVTQLTKIVESLQLQQRSGKANGGVKSNQPPRSNGNNQKQYPKQKNKSHPSNDQKHGKKNMQKNRKKTNSNTHKSTPSPRTSRSNSPNPQKRSKSQKNSPTLKRKKVTFKNTGKETNARYI